MFKKGNKLEYTGDLYKNLGILTCMADSYECGIYTLVDDTRGIRYLIKNENLKLAAEEIDYLKLAKEVSYAS